MAETATGGLSEKEDEESKTGDEEDKKKEEEKDKKDEEKAKSNKNEGKERKDRYWWLEKAIIPIIVALIGGVVPAGLAWLLAREVYRKTLLPIQPNPSTRIQGKWNITFAAIESYSDPSINRNSADVGTTTAADQTQETALIVVEETPPTFTATAVGGGRQWKIEGYVDGDSILYVYKDVENPNSFGSAFLRQTGAGSRYVGVWTGASPTFTRTDGTQVARPFVVRGKVAWDRPQD